MTVYPFAAAMDRPMEVDMAERINGEPGLVGGMTAELGGPRTAALLDRLDKAVPWTTLVKSIVALPEYRRHATSGRPR